MSVVKMLEAQEKQETFGQFLAAELKRRNWSPNLFCEKLGKKTGGWVYNLLNGRALPTRKSIETMARVLQIDERILIEKRGQFAIRLAGDPLPPAPRPRQLPLPPVVFEPPSTMPQFILEYDGDKMRLSFSGRVSFESGMRIIEILRQEKLLP